MLNKNNKNNDLELTNEAKERVAKVQVVIDCFEEVTLKYGVNKWGYRRTLA